MIMYHLLSGMTTTITIVSLRMLYIMYYHVCTHLDSPSAQMFNPLHLGLIQAMTLTGIFALFVAADALPLLSVCSVDLLTYYLISA